MNVDLVLQSHGNNQSNQQVGHPRMGCSDSPARRAQEYAWMGAYLLPVRPTTTQHEHQASQEDKGGRQGRCTSSGKVHVLPPVGSGREGG